MIVCEYESDIMALVLHVYKPASRHYVCVCVCVRSQGWGHVRMRGGGGGESMWSSRLHILQLWGHGLLGVLALKMLLVGLGVRHLSLADAARVHERHLGGALLVVSLGFLGVGRPLRRFLLRLYLLLAPSHYSLTRAGGRRLVPAAP